MLEVPGLMKVVVLVVVDVEVLVVGALVLEQARKCRYCQSTPKQGE